MAPSAPGYPRERATAQRAEGRRTTESFDWYESARLVLAASTVFQEVISFSGRPDSIVLDATATGVEFRLRNRGGPPGSIIRIEGIAQRDLQVSAEIVEARDPAGAGGQGVTATGRWASRNIDERSNRGGPNRAKASLPQSELATQVPTGDDPD